MILCTKVAGGLHPGIIHEKSNVLILGNIIVREDLLSFFLFLIITGATRAME